MIEPQASAALTAARELRRAGRFDAAAAAFKAAAASAQLREAALAGLAECLFAGRNPEAALSAWDMLLQIAPKSVVALTGKARVCLSLNRLGEAQAIYAAALAIDAGSVEARLGIARLQTEAGDFATANATLSGIAPDQHHRAEIRWLSARIALGMHDPDRAASILAELLHLDTLAPEQRADALLLLSEALDALNRVGPAFSAAVAGKAIYHALYAERAAGREAEVDKYRRLTAWFDATGSTLAPAQTADALTTGHAFLVGFPRSGTTLLEQVLAGHPNIVALEEAPTLADAYAEFLADDAGCERLAQLGESGAALWRKRYWAVVAANGVDPRGKLFLDKAPAGTVYLPLIARLFPEARILFARRDPRDVVLSCLRHAFQMNALTYAFTRLEDTAACYDACMTLAAAYRRVLPLAVLDVRHETLVEDFDAELARITAFLGITVDPGMRAIAATAAARTVRTPSAPQVRAGLNRRGLARWRAYASELSPVMPVLDRWVEAYGYPPA